MRGVDLFLDVITVDAARKNVRVFEKNQSYIM